MRLTYATGVLMLFSLAWPGQASLSQATAAPDASASTAPRNCDNLPNSDHPSTRLSNGKLAAVVLLPDAERGYYRSSRFDWSGLIACASLDGHTFFGQWFDRYDPLITDAVTGPAEEFRNPNSEIGYDQAAPGGLFLKIGVGLLRRVDNSPYAFGNTYPVVDHGHWTVKVHRYSITFRQVLRSKLGYAYSYEKVLSLDPHSNILTLEHRLHNLGTKPLDTAVYDHDFYMLDGQPTGPGMEIHLPFAPKPDPPFPPYVATDNDMIHFTAPIPPGKDVGAYIQGYSASSSDYDFVIKDTQRGIGVEQTSTSPIARMYFWATSTTICPEAYIAIHVPPGQTQQWKIQYRFFTK